MNGRSDDFLFLSEADIKEVIGGDLLSVIPVIEEALILNHNSRVIMPDKISMVFDHEAQDRINCMPSMIRDYKISGVKWVSVFPSNVTRSLPNVNASVLLSDSETGKLLAFVASSYCTMIRTAGVGVLAARELSVPDPVSIGMIGAGQEARMHFQMLIKQFPSINECRVSSRTNKSEQHFIASFIEDYPDVKFISCCSDYSAAALDADIIVTAISGQAPLLKAKDIKYGALYIHVGGYEDEYEVPLKASKIVCDEWNSVKHRSQTVSRMYIEGLLKDKDIYADLAEILLGIKAGRENNREFIYFNSVGLSCVDVLLAYSIYQKAKQLEIGQKIRL